VPATTSQAAKATHGSSKGLQGTPTANRGTQVFDVESQYVVGSSQAGKSSGSHVPPGAGSVAQVPLGIVDEGTHARPPPHPTGVSHASPAVAGSGVQTAVPGAAPTHHVESSQSGYVV
jgi:hypothetical protein